MLNCMSDPRQPSHPQHQVPPYISQSSPAPTNTNPAGRAGLIIGLVGLAIGVLVNVFVQVLIRTGGFTVASIFSTLGSLLAFAAALTALILGLVGLKRIGAPHGAAGIAAGLGIAGVVTILFSLIISAMDWLLYF